MKMGINFIRKKNAWNFPCTIFFFSFNLSDKLIAFIQDVEILRFTTEIMGRNFRVRGVLRRLSGGWKAILIVSLSCI